MKKLAIGLLILGILLFAACAPLTGPVLTPQKTKSTAESLPLPPLDPKIATLLNKNKDATNYNYAYDAEKAEGYTVYRVGNNAKKVYAEAVKSWPNLFFTTIYLDFEKKTAYGSCEKPGAICSEQWNKAYPLDFSLQEFAPSPPDLARAVPATAQKVGGENVDARSTEIIEYINAEGKLERLSLDKFYGLPLKQIIYSSADPKSEIKIKHTYIRLSVGQLKENDVALPEAMKVLKS